MIQLDENHWVSEAKEVRAIRPMWIPSPDPITSPNRRASIVDPERCMVLIANDWVQIERGAQGVARQLAESNMAGTYMTGVIMRLIKARQMQLSTEQGES